MKRFWVGATETTVPRCSRSIPVATHSIISIENAGKTIRHDTTRYEYACDTLLSPCRAVVVMEDEQQTYIT